MIYLAPLPSRILRRKGLTQAALLPFSWTGKGRTASSSSRARTTCSHRRTWMRRRPFCARQTPSFCNSKSHFDRVIHGAKWDFELQNDGVCLAQKGLRRIHVLRCEQVVRALDDDDAVLPFPVHENGSNAA